MDSGDCCTVFVQCCTGFVQVSYRFRTGATFSRFEKAREREEATQKIYIKKPSPPNFLKPTKRGAAACNHIQSSLNGERLLCFLYSFSDVIAGLMYSSVWLLHSLFVCPRLFGLRK
jgi:hypothetical protein